jgi:hypothetical protein
MDSLCRSLLPPARRALAAQWLLRTRRADEPWVERGSVSRPSRCSRRAGRECVTARPEPATAQDLTQPQLQGVSPRRSSHGFRGPRRATEDTDRHRVHIGSADDPGAAVLVGIEVEPTAGRIRCAAQASSQEIGQGRIFDCTDDLTAAPAERGEHLDQVQRSVIVDVLDRVVQNQRLPAAPWPSQVDRQQKCEPGSSSLTAAAQDNRGLSPTIGSVPDYSLIFRSQCYLLFLRESVPSIRVGLALRPGTTGLQIRAANPRSSPAQWPTPP